MDYDDDEQDNTYNRVAMSKMEMPLQRKENDKHKDEDTPPAPGLAYPPLGMA